MRDVIYIHTYATNERYRWRLFQNILRSISNALFFNVSVTNIFNAENSRILVKKWFSNERKKQRKIKLVKKITLFQLLANPVEMHKTIKIYNWMDVAHNFLKFKYSYYLFKCNDFVKFRAEQMYLSRMHSFYVSILLKMILFSFG